MDGSKGSGFLTARMCFIRAHRSYGSMHTTCMKLNEAQIQTQRNKSGHKVPPLTRKLFVIDTQWRREISSIHSSNIWYITTLQDRFHAQKQMVNKKISPYYFFMCFLFCFIIVLVFLMVYFVFFFYDSSFEGWYFCDTKDMTKFGQVEIYGRS